MSDIVERLRQTKGSSPQWPDAKHGRVLINPDGPEAADEIDRLREALKEIVSRDMHWDRTGDKLGACGRIAKAALAKEAGE